MRHSLPLLSFEENACQLETQVSSLSAREAGGVKPLSSRSRRCQASQLEKQVSSLSTQRDAGGVKPVSSERRRRCQACQLRETQVSSLSAQTQEVSSLSTQRDTRGVKPVSSRCSVMVRSVVPTQTIHVPDLLQGY